MNERQRILQECIAYSKERFPDVKLTARHFKHLHRIADRAVKEDRKNRLNLFKKMKVLRAWLKNTKIGERDE